MMLMAIRIEERRRLTGRSRGIDMPARWSTAADTSPPPRSERSCAGASIEASRG